MSSQNSIEPLNTTEKTMRGLLGSYNIGTEFLDILFAMGSKPRESEAGLRRMIMKEVFEGIYGETMI
jgi:hypothetical protein